MMACLVDLWGLPAGHCRLQRQVSGQLVGLAVSLQVGFKTPVVPSHSYRCHHHCADMVLGRQERPSGHLLCSYARGGQNCSKQGFHL